MSVAIVSTDRTFAKSKNLTKITFADFDIRHQLASLRKLYFVTLIYFSKVKDSNRDLRTLSKARTSVTNASTRLLPKVANARTSVTAVLTESLPGRMRAYPQLRTPIRVRRASSSGVMMAIFAANQIAG